MKGTPLPLIVLLLIQSCQKEEDPFGQICDACSQVELITVNDSVTVSFKNFISPNSDAINDVFHPRAESADGPRELNEVFTGVSFRLMNPSGKRQLLFTVDREVDFDGSDGNGGYAGDGIYSYELNLDGKIYTRLLGVYIHPFCLSAMDCKDSCGISLRYDPMFTAGCD